MRLPGSAVKLTGPPPFWRKTVSTITRPGSRSTASQAARSVGYEPRSSSLGGPPLTNRASKAVSGHAASLVIEPTRKNAVARASGATLVTPASDATRATGMGFDELEVTTAE